MYYIVQERLYNEFEWDNLIDSLERLELPYEIVKVRPFIDTIEFKTDRKDVFCIGALKMARIAEQYSWKPGCIMTPNHDFMVYKDYYKDNLLNYDSKIYKFMEDFEWNENYDLFIRPTKDTKVFDGKVYSKGNWLKERTRLMNNANKERECGRFAVLDNNTDIQVCSLKNVKKEFRFWIVGGEIITASLYRIGCFITYNDIIDDDVTEYCKEMIKIFQPAESFVMDICLTDNGLKIIELGCLNCAGLYKANIPKLLMSLENFYN